MNLAGLDMNLVVALRALLAERNVTRAGQRVGLSQPAMSAALARLRRHFGDELLVRSGSGYELTALGAVLLDRAGRRLRAARAGVRQPGALRAGQREEREFVILASDYAVAVYGARLAREVSALAPGVRLVFRHVPSEITESAGGAAVHRRRAAHAARRDQRPARGRPVPRHLGLRGGGRQPPGRRAASRCSSSPSCPGPSTSASSTPPWAASCPPSASSRASRSPSDSFQLLPALVAGTSRVAMMHARLARHARPRPGGGVRLLPCPFDAVPVQEALWWHPVHTHDAGHIWLREMAGAVGARVAA